MPQARSLTVDAVLHAQQLYEQRDGRGRRIYSIQKIARLLGCSETTAQRAIGGFGSYAHLPPVSVEENTTAAAASEQRLLGLLKQETDAAIARRPENLLKELDDDKAGYPE